MNILEHSAVASSVIKVCSKKSHIVCRSIDIEFANLKTSPVEGSTKSSTLSSDVVAVPRGVIPEQGVVSGMVSPS